MAKHTPALRELKRAGAQGLPTGKQHDQVPPGKVKRKMEIPGHS